MKRTDVKKLANMSAAELLKNVAESKEKLWEMKRDVASGKVKNAHAITVLRRDIARMLFAAQANTKKNS